MGRLPIELSRDTTETCEAMVFPHLPRDGPFLFGFTTGDDMPSRDPASRSQRAARHRLYALLPQVQWLLEASLDGQSWLELHRQDRARHCSSAFKLMCRLLPVPQDTNFATPTSRFSMTQLFDVTTKFAELLGRADERRPWRIGLRKRVGFLAEKYSSHRGPGPRLPTLCRWPWC